MDQARRMGGAVRWIALVFAACPLLIAAPGDAGKRPSPSPAVAYIGSERCADCHAAQFEHLKQTTMGKIFLRNPRTPLEKQGCEACHGPGAAHADSNGKIGLIRFTKNSPQPIELRNDQCLQCHEKGNRLFWRGSTHESRGVACTSCHQVHTEQTSVAADRFQEPLSENRQFVKPTQMEVCFQCHQMRRAQLQRSSHMPFREGKVTCSSCHNPHGTPNPKLLIEATVNDTCYKCHAERRGPFLWEHPPVMENCLNCHDAHGSTNPTLLKVRAPRLCMQCHDVSGHNSDPLSLSPNPPRISANQQISTRGLRVINRSCTNCHAQIHGSNHPAGSRYLR